MYIRRAATSDEQAPARIRRNAILALAVPALSPEAAEPSVTPKLDAAQTELPEDAISPKEEL